MLPTSHATRYFLPFTPLRCRADAADADFKASRLLAVLAALRMLLPMPPLMLMLRRCALMLRAMLCGGMRGCSGGKAESAAQ